MAKQNLLGEDGCIVIDTLETYEMAKEALQIFQDQFNLGTPSKPIKAIILTHFHPDHTFGYDIFKVLKIILILF